MKRSHVWRRLWLAAGAALMLLLAAPPARAQVDFGVRAGAYLEHSDPFVGLELLTRLGNSDFYFNPNVEATFGGERDKVSGNLDFHYDFRVDPRHYLWVGAGPAVIHTEAGRGRSSSTDAGLDLLGGIGWRRPGMTPYAQLKIVIADDSQVVAGVGIRF
jgi:hypothetical protein